MKAISSNRWLVSLIVAMLACTNPVFAGKNKNNKRRQQSAAPAAAPAQLSSTPIRRKPPLTPPNQMLSAVASMDNTKLKGLFEKHSHLARTVVDTETGFTLLHYAVFTGNLEAVQMLIEAGVDYMAVSSDESEEYPGMTALQIAMELQQSAQGEAYAQIPAILETLTNYGWELAADMENADTLIDQLNAASELLEVSSDDGLNHELAASDVDMLDEFGAPVDDVQGDWGINQLPEYNSEGEDAMSLDALLAEFMEPEEGSSVGSNGNAHRALSPWSSQDGSEKDGASSSLSASADGSLRGSGVSASGDSDVLSASTSASSSPSRSASSSPALNPHEVIAAKLAAKAELEEEWRIQETEPLGQGQVISADQSSLTQADLRQCFEDLKAAIAMREIRMLAELLAKAPAKLLAMTDRETGATLLHLALETENLSVVQTVLEAHPNVLRGLPIDQNDLNILKHAYYASRTHDFEDLANALIVMIRTIDPSCGGRPTQPETINEDSLEVERRMSEAMQNFYSTPLDIALRALEHTRSAKKDALRAIIAVLADAQEAALERTTLDTLRRNALQEQVDTARRVLAPAEEAVEGDTLINTLLQAISLADRKAIKAAALALSAQKPTEAQLEQIRRALEYTDSDTKTYVEKKLAGNSWWSTAAHGAAALVYGVLTFGHGTLWGGAGPSTLK